MTHTEFLTLTVEQRTRLQEVYHRPPTSADCGGLNFIDWLEENTSPPTPLGEYVGVNWCGMFLGVERDGHCHS